jgi:hypothetical protein
MSYKWVNDRKDIQMDFTLQVDSLTTKVADLFHYIRILKQIMNFHKRFVSGSGS